jgi:hypothetical protein
VRLAGLDAVEEAEGGCGQAHEARSESLAALAGVATTLI